jgi:hypothetical protein
MRPLHAFAGHGPGAEPRPFAIGLVGVPADGPLDQREERLQVALAAHALGYSLLDVIEIRPGDQAGYERAEELARRTDADAFVVRGALDHAVLTAMADRGRMLIRYS